MTEETIVTILADSTEAESPVLSRLKSLGAHVRLGDLEVGTHVISGETVVLRMNATEFVESILDGRLFHRAGKMSLNFPRSIFLIEGDAYSTRAAIAREAIDGALAFLVGVEGASVLYVRNPTATADLLFRLAKQAQKDLTYGMAFQRAKVSPGRQQALFTIESVFGIGPATAAKALTRFRSVYAFITASVEQLTEIPGIGPKKAERIHNSIRWQDDNDSDIHPGAVNASSTEAAQ
ncbi:helix-hairpin-helix domain-containing protein [Pseudomonas aeruginosa]|nr:helix-hairpin-helix domain-containing protein [Pseudomonas aeruginosa]MCS8510179.1 helix-hairpin-helix domain-containing protein [Pseudomonas aeruginosa]MCS8541313.1 helix-hairpin-helix domain-containing protein [Pseudomonas aeruginosa]MCT0600459.1 helix-hairpin-helix domain-containing protein [Pseudomonas aeruginosa]